MLSILILSQYGEGKHIADKLIHEGHIVKFWAADAKTEQAAQNVYQWQKVDRYQEYIQTTDLFIFTTSGIGGLAEDLRRRGKMVVGGSLQELLVKDSGLTSAAFNCLGMMPCSDTLQGVPLTFCGLYDGKNIHSFITQHYARLLEGERGPVFNMGCLAVKEDSPVQTLIPILQTMKFKGLVQVRVRVTENVIKIEDINTDLSDEILPAVLEIVGKNLGDVLYKLAAGSLRIDPKFLYGLSLKLIAMSAEAVFKPIPQAVKHCWNVGCMPVLGYISAGGITPNEARRRVYRTVSNTLNQDVIYRRDVGCNSILEQEIHHAVDAIEVEEGSR